MNEINDMFEPFETIELHEDGISKMALVLMVEVKKEVYGIMKWYHLGMLSGLRRENYNVMPIISEWRLFNVHKAKHSLIRVQEFENFKEEIKRVK